MSVTRALVLGAGGPAAIAWETGVIVGLADMGIDVRNADLIVGTSAGSIVAARITGGPGLEDLFQQQVEHGLQHNEIAVSVDFKQLRSDYLRARQGEGGDLGILQRMGALAMSASTISESERRRVIASRLPAPTWPETRFRAVAVDAESGERRVLERAKGVVLVDAVAASCAVPGVSPTITIEGHRYMDGGVYSIDNADLALGTDRILVLTLRSGNPPICVRSLGAAVETLRHSGAQVVVIHPDAASEAAFAAVGGNLLDPQVRASAARAGRAQGRHLAVAAVAPLWQEARDRAARPAR
jgi:NTE family protein